MIKLIARMSSAPTPTPTPTPIHTLDAALNPPSLGVVAGAELTLDLAVDEAPLLAEWVLLVVDRVEKEEDSCVFDDALDAAREVLELFAEELDEPASAAEAFLLPQMTDSHAD